MRAGDFFTLFLFFQVVVGQLERKRCLPFHTGVIKGMRDKSPAVIIIFKLTCSFQTGFFFSEKKKKKKMNKYDLM